MSKIDNLAGYNDKANINCLPCIYTVYHLNPYKMVVFKN